MSKIRVDILLTFLPKTYEYYYNIIQDHTTHHNISEIEGKVRKGAIQLLNILRIIQRNLRLIK